MRVGVLGTGMVGDAIASKLIALGHEVMMGSREASNPKAVAWAKRVGAHAQAGAFADAAQFGEVLFNCTNGANSISALHAAGEDHLSGKTLIDVANVLPPDTSRTESLSLSVSPCSAATSAVVTTLEDQSESLPSPT